MIVKIFSVLAFSSFGALLSAGGDLEPSVVSTPAHILGDLADGTPPPEPQKPPFIVPAADILESETHYQGGRKITVQRITPILLPTPPSPKAEIIPAAQVAEESIEAAAEETPDAGFLQIGASVYRLTDGAPRSFVTVWPQGQGEAVSFWSSADFALLSGFGSFIGSDGKSRSLIMSWDVHEIASFHELTVAPDVQDGLPPVPVLTDSKAAFAITSGNPTAETLAAIDSLHDLYYNEHARLLTTFQGRETARLAQEAEVKANPPKPKDLVLNYWDGEIPTPTEKANAP